METLKEIVTTLCESSRTHVVDPYAELIDRFPAQLDREQWFMPPELISLHGTPTWQALSEPDRKRLSFFETVNFFSFTLQGERTQLEGLAERLYAKDTTEATPYLHHFLDEENNHMAYFGRFCMQYAGKVYPPLYEQKPIEREYEPGEKDFLFFVKLMMFEELGDAYNVIVARDTRIVPIVRDINRLHHKDEARHLAFGRKIVKEIFERHSPSWSPETLKGVRRNLQDFLVASWWEFYSHKVYRDAGVPGDPFEVREQAFEDPACRAHRKTISSAMVSFLVKTGIFLAEPSLG